MTGLEEIQKIATLWLNSPSAPQRASCQSNRLPDSLLSPHPGVDIPPAPHDERYDLLLALAPAPHEHCGKNLDPAQWRLLVHLAG